MSVFVRCFRRSTVLSFLLALSCVRTEFTCPGDSGNTHCVMCKGSSLLENWNYGLSLLAKCDKLSQASPGERAQCYCRGYAKVASAWADGTCCTEYAPCLKVSENFCNLATHPEDVIQSQLDTHVKDGLRVTYQIWHNDGGWNVPKVWLHVDPADGHGVSISTGVQVSTSVSHVQSKIQVGQSWEREEQQKKDEAAKAEEAQRSEEWRKRQAEQEEESRKKEAENEEWKSKQAEKSQEDLKKQEAQKSEEEWKKKQAEKSEEEWKKKEAEKSEEEWKKKEAERKQWGGNQHQGWGHVNYWHQNSDVKHHHARTRASRGCADDRRKYHEYARSHNLVYRRSLSFKPNSDVMKLQKRHNDNCGVDFLHVRYPTQVPSTVVKALSEL